MKGLAWYTAVLVGVYELYFLSQVISGQPEETFLFLFCAAIFAPMAIFAIKFIYHKK